MFCCPLNLFSQKKYSLEELTEQKKVAVQNNQLQLAKIIQDKIDLESSSAIKTNDEEWRKNPQTVIEVNKLEQELIEATSKSEWTKATDLKKEIEIKKGNGLSQNKVLLEKLTEQKKIAVKNNQLQLAKVLQDEINLISFSVSNINNEEWRKNPQTIIEVNNLEQNLKEATSKSDWTTASKIKKEIENKKGNGLSNSNITTENGTSQTINQREINLQKIIKEGFRNSNATTVKQKTTGSINSGNYPGKVRDAIDNSLADIKYRRSSLYTIMINNPTRLYNNEIKDIFGNTPLSEKFNDHNIGPYLINDESIISDQSFIITAYLKKNNVAKKLIEKWFNRSNAGVFNMDLIASRGEYNSSTYDKLIASSSQRGNALLADAGEDLIGNTFVVVYDLKYIQESLSLKGAALGVVLGPGKGYSVKTTSYLYRLVWNDSIADVFYNNYWVDENYPNQNKIQAFDKSNLFQLRYVGKEEAKTLVHASVYSFKSIEYLIKKAAGKAIDSGIAKLQRKFEEFRTKTSLFSVDPLTAAIGLKEDLKAGDKYEVLEQYIDLNGKTQFKRKGIIKVKKDMIWDNTVDFDEETDTPQKQTIDKTYFVGASGLYSPGMLIKQIN